MSNNTFEPSDVPSWFTNLPSLTTLMMEGTQHLGAIPYKLFSLPQLQTVEQKKNDIKGTLDLGVEHSMQLKLVDLEKNDISAYTKRFRDSNLDLILVENMICADKDGKYCMSHVQSDISYTTPQNCQYYFIGSDYTNFADEPEPSSKGSKKILTIGAACYWNRCGMLCISADIVVCWRNHLCRKKSGPITVEPANPSGFASSTSWTNPGGNTSNVELKEEGIFHKLRSFSSDEISTFTNDFSETNIIGSGSREKVYKGTLPNGRLISVKRAEQGSGRGGLEFKSEVELLSRVHHKNLGV